MMRSAMLALALGLAACAPTETVKQESEESAAVQLPTAGDVEVIRVEQNGQTVNLAVDQRFVVELLGTPTAGYVWAPTQVPGFVTHVGEATRDTVPEQSEPGYTGGNHWEATLFVVNAAGSGELTLEQRRPWESSEPPNQTFRVTIVAR